MRCIMGNVRIVSFRRIYIKSSKHNGIYISTPWHAHFEQVDNFYLVSLNIQTCPVISHLFSFFVTSSLLFCIIYYNYLLQCGMPPLYGPRAPTGNLNLQRVFSSPKVKCTRYPWCRHASEQCWTINEIKLASTLPPGESEHLYSSKRIMDIAQETWMMLWY